HFGCPRNLLDITHFPVSICDFSGRQKPVADWKNAFADRQKSIAYRNMPLSDRRARKSGRTIAFSGQQKPNADRNLASSDRQMTTAGRLAPLSDRKITIADRQTSFSSPHFTTSVRPA